MTLKFLGKKEGMTQVFDDKGRLVVCTVITLEPNLVAQVKTKEKDGYNALQLAGFKVRPSQVKNISSPLSGHFKKAGIDPRKVLKEARVEGIEGYQAGQEVVCSIFAETPFVDVSAVSKGKGYQGVMRRYNFRGGPASHGSGFHRHGGSNGMRTSPGRCLPGMKKAGRMGGNRVTTQSLRVVRLDVEKKVMLVEGAVPGARGAVVEVQRAEKRQQAKTK